MNAEPRQGQVPIGPLVATVGALLLIASLFLDWYEQLTAFTVFEFLDLLLVLLALATIASLVGGLGLIRPAISPGISLAVALFTVYVVASQVVNHPPAAAGDGGPAKEIGIWLALSGSAVMVVGAVLGYARISLAVQARPRDGGPRDQGHEDTTVATPATDAPAKPEPRPGRPVASDDEPERP